MHPNNQFFLVVLTNLFLQCSYRKTKGKKELFFGGCGEGMSHFIDWYESHRRTTLSEEKQQNEKVKVSISYQP